MYIERTSILHIIFNNGDLMNCIRSRHQGHFGEVKQLGRRALREWNEGLDNRNDVVMGQAPMLDG
jgi:hypothetical protein